MKTDPNVNVVENHLHVTLIKPFSPPILKSVIDPKIVDSLNEYCDKLIEEGGHDTSHRSISNNSGELNCDLSGFTDFGLVNGTGYNLGTDSGINHIFIDNTVPSP